MKIYETKGIVHVTSEPGDATRYSYYICRRGDVFKFMPDDNTFAYPQSIDYWQVRQFEMTYEGLVEYCQEHYPGVNPHTFNECLKTIFAIMNHAVESVY